jgi:hypothetical protein
MARGPLVLAVLAVVWLAALVAGQHWLLGYESAAGGQVEPPTDWPADSQVPRQPGRFTLVLFAHPHCPCTRATLTELAWLTARGGDRAAAQVLFVVPPGAPADWTDSSLTQQARATPGVTVGVDQGGAESRHFGAVTSGQVLLYDPAGRLVFRGGITAGRGHGGDNPGRAAVLGWLTGTGAARHQAPVYGCPLLEEDKVTR